MRFKNKFIYLFGFFFIITLIFILRWSKNEQVNNINNNIILPKEDKNSNLTRKEPKKNDSEILTKSDEEVHFKDLSPTEYIAWLKSPQNRVLLEIKNDGVRIYRKGNVTITVMPDGEELYLPDEL